MRNSYFSLQKNSKSSKILCVNEKRTDSCRFFKIDMQSIRIIKCIFAKDSYDNSIEYF